jgi:HSP20 family protein
MANIAPFKGMPGFRREIDRLFDRFFEPQGWFELPSLGEWAPSMDVSENKDAFVVKMEVPGMEPGDIQVSIEDNALTVKGEKKQEKEQKEEKYHRVERSYGAFQRMVRLPTTVDAGKVTATFKNGVLTATLPKTLAAKGTTIPIKAE